MFKDDTMMSQIIKHTFTSLLALLLLGAPALHAQNTPKTGSAGPGGVGPGGVGNAKAGEAVFKRACATCHSVDLAKPKLTGPTLHAIVGKKAGTGDFKRYSSGLRQSNIVWDVATLERYLANPRDVVKGGTMLFRLPKPQERADVIAYLQTIK
jgi:cytochrome c